MKRSGPPHRRTELARGEGPKRKTQLKRGSGPKRRRKPRLPEKDRIAAQEFYRHTMQRGEAKCAVTGERWRARAKDDPLRLTAHHVIERSELKARGLGHLEWDADNGLIVTQQVHHDHHFSARKPIRRRHLTERNLRFAKKHHLMHLIEANYP